LNTNTPSDTGSEPTTSEATVRAHLNASLKDPSSVMGLTISQPSISYCDVGVYGRFYGYRVAVTYNAKNSYGAYVGARSHYYWFHGETLKGIGNNPNYCPEAPAWR
jgi:hypothetical protein